MRKPEQIQEVDLTAVRKACQEYIDFLGDEEDYHEDSINDYEYEVMEKAMEAIFGDDVWKYVNTIVK
jgi:hypothetical protein